MEANRGMPQLLEAGKRKEGPPLVPAEGTPPFQAPGLYNCETVNLALSTSVVILSHDSTLFKKTLPRQAHRNAGTATSLFHNVTRSSQVWASPKGPQQASCGSPSVALAAWPQDPGRCPSMKVNSPSPAAKTRTLYKLVVWEHQGEGGVWGMGSQDGTDIRTTLCTTQNSVAGCQGLKGSINFQLSTGIQAHFNLFLGLSFLIISLILIVLKLFYVFIY